jgi:dihydropyrimidinase
VLAGRISLDQFVALTSANAARIFGLYPRKGAIIVGSDADIALWDPRYRRTIGGARMQSLSGYSVYDGWQVQGWPKFVIRRGQLVLADGQITARPGDGEWLRRTTTARALPSRPRRPLPPGFTQAHNYAYTASGHSCAQSQLRPRSACLRRSILSAA